jgi:hypothetical protein
LALALATPTFSLGFLTVLREVHSYQGGYLVTNRWGRPLEFRLSTVVQPNRVQQILYAETLAPYVCGDLIGKTLVEKAGVAVQMVVTDTEAVLDLRNRVEVPVVFLASTGKGEATMAADFCAHARFPDDAANIEELLEAVRGTLNLAEPFLRIREAMTEARKMGVTNRG